jgi:uncharacterized membrane protein
MLHPAAAHFAIALPIISLVLGLVYIYKPSELMSKLSTRFMVFAALFLIAAFFTGKADAALAFESLSSEGQNLLKEHKELGLYLVLSMVLAAIVKFLGCYKKFFKLEMLAVLMVALISAGILYQGKLGGEVTYTHGANVKNHADGLTCIEDPEFYLDMKE